MRASSVFVIFCIAIGVTPSLALPMPCTEGNDHRTQLTRRQVMPNLRRRMNHRTPGSSKWGQNTANRTARQSSLDHKQPPKTTRPDNQASHPPGTVPAAAAAERVIANADADAPAPGAGANIRPFLVRRPTLVQDGQDRPGVDEAHEG
ncbi:hypothetical protein F5148DRAFT_1272662 [Russula earlei]|uniref:Uncharacterized protein n=1 Tax=Russula earlei TaxID=71964 RepID=A0ACC0TRA2_9AGAM|nr:hypothetical protein F5148DRAFT_1272662 [Russula earlei]